MSFLIMNKLVLQWFFFFSLFLFNYAVEYEEGNGNSPQAYNLNKLITKSLNRIHNFRSFNEESPSSIINLQFRGIDIDAERQQYENLAHNSSKCLKDIMYILLNIKNLWALRVFDSFGKPESGFLEGRIKWIGDYNECIQVRSTNPNSTTGNFHGKYCSLTTSMSLMNTTIPMSLEIGVCVPDSCSAAELQNILQLSHAAGIGSIVPDLNDTKSTSKFSITCKPTERHLNASAIAMIVVLSVFCTLSVLGSSITAVKYFKKIIEESKDSSLIVSISENDHAVEDGHNIQEKHESEDVPLIQDIDSSNQRKDCLRKLETFLGCFCVFTNGAKLLNTDSSEGQLLCIHGIRFLSMSWVILGHTYLFSYSVIGNILEAAESLNTFGFQIILQGFYSVDSFFVLSGFLLAYLAMKEFAKTKGVIAWPYFYIHRYIRLTPIYMVILGFSATLYFYMGSGPFWPDIDLDPNCRDNWWQNLIYLNNFKDSSVACMGWSWYLANDMQFFVISPLFLISLWRWPRIGYALIGTFLLACWFSNFFITYHFDLMAGMAGMISQATEMTNMAEATEKALEYFNKIYIKPYTRIAPYLIGILVGYLLFKRNASSKPKHSLIFLAIGWIVATTITLACVFGLYHRHPDVLASSFYNALHRTTFALGLSWVIYVCLIGQGGFVNSILSYKLFIPLSRLTYAAYLIHPMIITGYYSSLRKSFEFYHPSMVLIFLGVMIVTYGLSLPIALILESPIVSLEKLVRKSFNRKENS